MAEEFCKLNNEKFGYKRFEFLYVEDTLSENERITLAQQKINIFFGD